jgi:hypothetical protein
MLETVENKLYLLEVLETLGVLDVMCAALYTGRR